MVKRISAAFAACALMMCSLFLAGCSTGENYQPALKEATVSSPVIGEDGTLRVGVNTEKSPLAGMNSTNDQIIGIDVDIAAAIADELGLKLSLVDVGSDPQTALEKGTVDIVMGIDSSESTTDFWTSGEYLPTGVGLFALSSNGTSVPDKSSNPKISAQISSTSAWAVGNVFGETALDSCVKITDAFAKLESGSTDYVAADVLIGMYAAHRDGIDAQIIALLSAPSGYCIGVAKSNTQLQSVVSDLVDQLTGNGVIDVIEKKWLGTTIDLSDVERIASSATTSTDTTSQEGGANESDTGLTDEAARAAADTSVSVGPSSSASATAANAA